MTECPREARAAAASRRRRPIQAANPHSATREDLDAMTNEDARESGSGARCQHNYVVTVRARAYDAKRRDARSLTTERTTDCATLCAMTSDRLTTTTTTRVVSAGAQTHRGHALGRGKVYVERGD